MVLVLMTLLQVYKKYCALLTTFSSGVCTHGQEQVRTVLTDTLLQDLYYNLQLAMTVWSVLRAHLVFCNVFCATSKVGANEFFKAMEISVSS